MAQQEPRPLPHCIAIGGLRIDDGAFEQPRPGEQFGEFGGARAIHRVDGISMVGIAEGHGDEKKASGCDELEAVAGQPVWLGDVLEQVGAEHGARSKAAQPPYIAGIGQIGAHIDTGQLAHIDMDNLDTTGLQWMKHLMRDPGLDRFADFGRTAAEIEQRGQTLKRESVEHLAQPTGFRFNHCGVHAFRRNPPCERGHANQFKRRPQVNIEVSA